MSLLGIAIVGKKNEPLYLCECTRLLWQDEQADDHHASNDPAQEETATSSSTTTTTTTTATPDPFGFLQSSSSSQQGQGQSLNMEQQFILHAALDRLEEQVGASTPDGTMPLRKAIRSVNNASGGSSSTGAATTSASSSAPSSAGGKKAPLALGPPAGTWLGLLTVQDEAAAVYGYVTATNVKFLALLEHPTAAMSSHTKNLSAAQSKAVKTLLTTLHGHYITYLLNPFRPIGETRLDSATFHASVKTAVRAFGNEQQQQGATVPATN